MCHNHINNINDRLITTIDRRVISKHTQRCQAGVFDFSLHFAYVTIKAKSGPCLSRLLLFLLFSPIWEWTEEARRRPVSYNNTWSQLTTRGNEIFVISCTSMKLFLSIFNSGGVPNLSHTLISCTTVLLSKYCSVLSSSVQKYHDTPVK